MHLQFRHRQSRAFGSFVPVRIGSAIQFSLQVSATLSQKETHLLKEYSFEDAILVEGDLVGLVRDALRYAVIYATAASLLLLPILGFFAGGFMTGLVFLAVLAYAYNQLREQIKVRDLINGRWFHCYSVVELLEKEAFLHDAAIKLSAVLEASANWKGEDSLIISAETEPLNPNAVKLLRITPTSAE